MWKRNFFRPEYLAVVISTLALVVSLIGPLEKLFAKPNLEISIAPGGLISTNYGTAQLSATISITNSGNAAATFDRITCLLKKGNEEHRFQANSFTISTPGAPVQNISLTGQQLGPSERFLNPINCVSLHENTTRISQFSLLSNRILYEVRSAGGLNCQRQYFEPYFSFSNELQKDIMNFFDSGKSFTEGTYSVTFILSNLNGEEIASKEVEMTIDQDQIAMLMTNREMFLKGFGHPGTCPLPLGWAVEVLLSDHR